MSEYVVECEEEEEVDVCSSVSDDMDNECIVCQQPTTRTCSFCNDVMICSMDCQQIAVNDDINSDHFDMCVHDATADTLYKDVLSNRIPRDTQTLQDFQFNWLSNRLAQRKLLGIYVKIIYQADVTPRELEIWVERNKLFERIAMLFLSHPELIGLDDLKWLKRTELWSDGFGKTTRGIFEDVIARKQGRFH
ncbi:hypothetical protein CKAH01_15572 [Colletotrichum kahawae]|uniref:MYND-type zinc finger protein samB n=1 Tax=Colletotrichum kahawae TaxID=34407 RepID=A0AAD9YK68_COLKA|nr:hypothetical protein CKAH01_15572 [Colletotrichum kahawae]